MRQVAAAISRVLDSQTGRVLCTLTCESAADPELARLIDDSIQRPCRKALLDLLRRGVERGEIHAAAATPLAADLMSAILTGRMHCQRAHERGITDIVEQVFIPLIAAR